jgi:hypothetical protein
LRHPLKAIPSIGTARMVSTIYAAQHTEENILGGSLTVQAARWWHYWNRMIRQLAVFHSSKGRPIMRYRVEDLFVPEVFNEFCRLAGAEPDLEKAKAVPMNTGSRKGLKFYEPLDSWEALERALGEKHAELFNQVRLDAEFYGYRV